jgi:DNA invertase Pin-like site-specific DNA recombinase
MMICGYVRVSTAKQVKGNSYEDQELALKESGAELIVKESFTGTKLHRPEFDKLIGKLQEGDTIKVTKLDRFARNAPEACNLIRALVDRGVTVHILNMGIADNSPMGKLMITILAAFAEFERDLIVERTQSGKAIAKTKEGYKDGRPPKYTTKQIKHALELLKEYSYTQVEQMTGISKATLVRAKRDSTSLN